MPLRDIHLLETVDVGLEGVAIMRLERKPELELLVVDQPQRGRSRCPLPTILAVMSVRRIRPDVWWQ